MTKREEDKPKIIFFGDIVEENGKTIKENNLAREHKYPIGSLVELENGERLFVMAYTRDCDGSPLYNLGFRWNKETLSRNHGEEHIKFAPLSDLAQIEESERLTEQEIAKIIREQGSAWKDCGETTHRLTTKEQFIAQAIHEAQERKSKGVSR